MEFLRLGEMFLGQPKEQDHDHLEGHREGADADDDVIDDFENRIKGLHGFEDTLPFL